MGHAPLLVHDEAVTSSMYIHAAAAIEVLRRVFNVPKTKYASVKTTTWGSPSGDHVAATHALRSLGDVGNHVAVPDPRDVTASHTTSVCTVAFVSLGMAALHTTVVYKCVRCR